MSTASPAAPRYRPTRDAPVLRRGRRWWRVLVAVFAVLLVQVGPGMLPAGGEGPPAEESSHSGRWLWPVDPPHEIVRAFEAPPNPYGPGHRGVDIGAGEGARILAVEDGDVHFAGQVAGRGVVSIRHSDGLLSTYEPLTPSVARGDRIGAGQEIGVLSEASGGGAHCSDATCLHLGARRGTNDYVDPEPLLRGMGPSVLLPLRERPSGMPPTRSDPGVASGPGTNGSGGTRPGVTDGRLAESRPGMGLIESAA